MRLPFPPGYLDTIKPSRLTPQMTTPIDIRQRAIALLDQLPSDRLQAIVQLLEFLSQPIQEATAQTPEELELLQIIQRRLPQEAQVRSPLPL